MGDRPVVTPEERAEVIAQDVPPQVRLAAYMPLGSKFLDFHRTETALAHMLELGLIPQELYEAVHNHRLSYRYYAPIASAPDVIRVVGEAKNPTPLLSMISQTVGAKKLGNELLPIRREDVPGMDARTLEELIQEPLVKKRLSWEAGLAIVRDVARRRADDGRMESEDATDLAKALAVLERQLKKLGIG